MKLRRIQNNILLKNPLWHLHKLFFNNFLSFLRSSWISLFHAMRTTAASLYSFIALSRLFDVTFCFFYHTNIDFCYNFFFFSFENKFHMKPLNFKGFSIQNIKVFLIIPLRYREWIKRKRQFTWENVCNPPRPQALRREHKKEISRANIKVVEHNRSTFTFAWIYPSLSL